MINLIQKRTFQCKFCRNNQNEINSIERKKKNVFSCVEKYIFINEYFHQ